jgi:hypothetical protein
LRELDLTNTQVTDTGEMELKAARPDLKINRC